MYIIHIYESVWYTYIMCITLNMQYKQARYVCVYFVCQNFENKSLKHMQLESASLENSFSIWKDRTKNSFWSISTKSNSFTQCTISNFLIFDTFFQKDMFGMVPTTEEINLLYAEWNFSRYNSLSNRDARLARVKMGFGYSAS